MRLNRRDVLLATAALILASLCVWAGSCQLDRLGQRRARNAAVAARLALPPLNVGRETSPTRPASGASLPGAPTISPGSACGGSAASTVRLASR